jgi:hypothetical protein
MGRRSLKLELPGGSSEELGFFGDLFGVTHLPAGEPRGSVLVVSPLYSEFLKNNRREVMLGRRLADAGYVVQRFQYRGTANSGGDAAMLSLESMAEDVAAAKAHLAEVGTGVVDVVATRLAVIPAAAAIEDESRFVMWEPSADGRKYFRELTRSLLILEMKKDRGRTQADFETEFEKTGALEIAGFSVARTLRDSAVTASLDVPSGTGAGLVVQLGRSTETRPQTQKVVDAMERAGRKADVVPLDFEEAWWFHQDANLLDPELGSRLDQTMVEATIDWLERGVV